MASEGSGRRRAPRAESKAGSIAPLLLFIPAKVVKITPWP